MSIKSLKDLAPHTAELKLTYTPESDDVITDDNGKEVKLYVGGYYCKQYKDATKQYFKKYGTEGSSDIDTQLELLAATVLDWEPGDFFDPEGDGKFTVEKMAQILEDYDWIILPQLREVLGQREKFLPEHTGSSKISNSTQNKNGVSGQQRVKQSKNTKSSS